MMNSFPLKFQQAESDKRNICHSKEGVRDNNSNSSHTQQSSTGEDGAQSPQQRSRATTERNRRENDKQINERRNRIG
jgi:hypothetical protein